MLGIVLLLIGFITTIPILWSIGIVVLAIGLILLILGVNVDPKRQRVMAENGSTVVG